MKKPLFFASLIAFSITHLFSTPPSPAEGVTVSSAELDELRRVARRSRIPAEQVRAARKALEKATELYLLDDHEISPHHANNLAQLWLQLDRAKAPSVMVSMTERLGRMAKSAQDENSFYSACEVIFSLASKIVYFQGEAVIDLSVKQCRAPQALAEATEPVTDRLSRLLIDERFLSAFLVNPERALAEVWAEARSDQASLYNRINRIRDADSFRAEFDGLLARVDRMPDARSRVDHLSNVLGIAARWDPSKAETLVENLLAEMGRMESGGGGVVMEGPEGEVSLDAREQRIMQVVRSLGSYPELLMDLIQANPGLQELVGRFGGVDQTVRARPIALRRPDGEIQRFHPGGQIEQPYEELKWNVMVRPHWVEQKLKAMTEENENGYQAVAGIAGRANYEAPELAELALEVLTERFFDGAEKRPNEVELGQLLQVYRNTGHEVPSELIDFGFELVAEMADREAESARGTIGSGPRGVIGRYGRVVTRGRHFSWQQLGLENTLLGYWARSDAEEAFRYIEKKDLTRVQFEMYTHLANSLSN